MSQFFQIHPDNPQQRLINHAVEIINDGGLVVYPTDSSYAIGCHIGDKRALDRLRMLRQLNSKHHFTLMCRDLSEIANYAKISNSAYRLLKSHTPGPYTFILTATHEVPRRLLSGKRKSIGIRVPNNKIMLALLEALGEPLMSTTLILPNDDEPMCDPYEIKDVISEQVDLIIDGGYCGFDLTTVVDLIDDDPKVLREGLGDASTFS
ncbi:MAG: threonylcarbamoyl-AMP synthase [Methylococcales bacterium]|nr:threonylcarbamoyl-AMP synthase [Methylococcales bacterium]MBT7444916.1 threonylcarbamoyl-AMP synthase [Methylococcales bacterium]